MNPHSKHRSLLISVLLSLFLILGGNAVVVDAQPFAPNPILLVVNDSAPYVYGQYLGEILRAEGLNEFDVMTTRIIFPLSTIKNKISIQNKSYYTQPKRIIIIVGVLWSVSEGSPIMRE